MKPISQAISLILLLLTLQIHGADTVTLQVRIDSTETSSIDVWIGVFATPLNSGDKALGWAHFESVEFELTVPNVEEAQLVVLRKDFLPLLQTVQPSVADDPIELSFEEGVTLTGTVLSTDNVPIEGALLRLERGDLPEVQIPHLRYFNSSSDSDGRYTIGGLSIGHVYSVKARHRNVPDETFNVEISTNENHSQDLRLSNAYMVLGRVLDTERNRVQEATVVATITDNDWMLRNSLEDTSDSSGEFRLGPFERNTDLWLSATHEERGSTRRVHAISGEHSAELILASLIPVTGVVIDETTGESINDFTLAAVRADGTSNHPHSNTDGKISALVDRDTTGLIVDSPFYNAHFNLGLELRAVQEHAMGTVALNPGRRLTGRVYDESSGQPIARARVSLHGWRHDETEENWAYFIATYLTHTIDSTTDDEGEYELGPLPMQTAFIEVVANEYPRQRYLTVDEGITVFDISLAKDTESIARIRGEVITPTGEPVGGKVHFLGENDRTNVSVGSDGKFDHGVEADVYSVFAVTDSGKSESAQVTVAEEEVRDITLIVDSTGRLRGNIKGLWSGEVVSLSLYSEAEQLFVRNTQDLPNGEFLMEGIGTGEFTLTAYSTRGRSQTTHFKVAEESDETLIELQFVGRSRLFGSLRYPDGSIPEGKVRAVAKEPGKTSVSADINRDGTFEVNGLDDGEYTLFTQKLNRLTWDRNDEQGMLSSARWTFLSEIDETDVVIKGDTAIEISLSYSANQE